MPEKRLCDDIIDYIIGFVKKYIYKRAVLVVHGPQMPDKWLSSNKDAYIRVLDENNAYQGLAGRIRSQGQI